VLASSFGFRAGDSTVALQAALDSGADVVIVDRTGSEWVTAPLFVRRDNMKIVFQDGVVVAAKVGAFRGDNDSLITLYNRSNVTLSGYGATLRMNKSEYSGQWRMVIKLLSVNHVLIEGLMLRDSGGDGIYIGNSHSGSQTYSNDVHIKDIACYNNRRQGITIISGQNILIENCWIALSNGTIPQGGIGFEPNYAYERLVNIVVRDVRLEENYGQCITVSTNNYDSSSLPVSATFQRFLCRSTLSNQGIALSGGGNGGLVEFQDGLIEATRDTGISSFRKPAYTSPLVRFRRCTMRYIGNLPVYVSGTDPGAREYGGLDWVDSVVEDPRSTTVVASAESSDSLGLANLGGKITVFDSSRRFAYSLSSTVGLSLGAKAHDIRLTLAHKGTLPPTLVNVAPSGTSFQITRASSDLTNPLAVVYDAPGGNLPGVAVIAPGQTSVTVTPVLFGGCNRIYLAWRPSYSIGTGQAQVCK